MGKIDIMKIQPSTITNDLEGKLIGIYGDNSVGKSYVAAHLFPADQILWIATEKGTSALNGLRIYDVENWSDFRDVVTQLTPNGQTKREAVRKMFKCVVVDVADRLPGMARDYIVSKYNTKMSASAEKKGTIFTPVKDIGDIPYGAGYGQWETEHDYWVNRLYHSGFCVVSIMHPEHKTRNFGTDDAFKYIVPKGVEDRVGRKLRDDIDFFFYVEANEPDENGRVVLSKAHTVSTRDYFARSRFTYCPELVDPFTAENVKETIKIACEKELEAQGATGVTNEQAVAAKDKAEQDKKVTAKDLIAMIKPVYAAVRKVDRETANSYVVQYLGFGEGENPRKISSTTDDDIKELQALYDDLVDFANENNIEYE